MTDAVSDRMLDAVALAGTPTEVREQFRARRAGLFDRALLWPPAIGGFAAAEAVIAAFRS
jgi:alkanesulfonate monooxygenase SsuD/methylene tetrahydromethanopterin reductase-like flavin-dependent oxidoreductase (luciferase family)